MSHHLEEVWYFMNAFNALSFLVLVVLATAWLRWILHVLEDALDPLRERRQKSVHPRVEPANLAAISQCEQPAKLETSLPRHPRQEGDKAMPADDSPSAAVTYTSASVHAGIGRGNLRSHSARRIL
jgi:hypothetical protein